jgi:DNA-binding transcriptional MerR regulator
MNAFDKSMLTKLYYTIGEVADMFSVNASLIRFWEKEFGIIQPKKNRKGNRLFTPKDIETFNKIYQLVKSEGYTIEGAKKALKLKTPNTAITSNNSPVETKKSPEKEDLIEKLESIRERLIQLKK